MGEQRHHSNLEDLGRERWSESPTHQTALTGHPQSKYNPEVHRTIIEAIEQGATLREAAAAAAINTDTLQRWRSTHPEFHAELKAARDRAGRSTFNATGQSKLTPEMEQAIVTALGLGTTIRAAAALVGIHNSTLVRWLDDDDPSFNDELYAKVEEAKAIQLQANLSIIQNAAAKKDTWQAAAWLNERLYPESFALGRARELPAGTRDDPIHTTNPLVEEMAAIVRERRQQMAQERLEQLQSDTSEEGIWQPPMLPGE